MEKKEYIITPQGSLGLLALGHIGIQKWRAVVQAQNKNQNTSDKKEKSNEKK